MALKDMQIAFTTDASGDSTDYGEKAICGRLIAVLYDRGDVVTGADLTLTTDRYGVVTTLLSVTDAGTSDLYWMPRTPSQDNTGTAVTYDGTNEIYEPFLIIGRPKLTVAQGGATKSGAVILVYEE